MNKNKNKKRLRQKGSTQLRDENTCISTNQCMDSKEKRARDNRKGRESNRSRAFDQLLDNSTPLPSTKKRPYKPDDNTRHSITKHGESCRAYRKTVKRSYAKRKFTGTQKECFDALIGSKHKFSDHMPASDLVARNKFGKYIIKLIQKEWKKSRPKSDLHPKIYFYHITFISDDFLISERDGEADVWKLKQKIQYIFRQYTKLNALGVIELQAITNYPKGKNGGSLSLHAHVLAWGPEELKREDISKRAKGFKAKLTRVPVLALKLPKLHDITSVARYISKPPYKGKYVDYEKLSRGKPCLEQVTNGLNHHHHLRIFEYMAKTPLELTLFAVGDGVPMRNKIVRKLRQWHKTRPGECMELGDKVDGLFADFLAQNKRLKNFKPLRVRIRR